MKYLKNINYNELNEANLEELFCEAQKEMERAEDLLKNKDQEIESLEYNIEITEMEKQREKEEKSRYKKQVEELEREIYDIQEERGFNEIYKKSLENK